VLKVFIHGLDVDVVSLDSACTLFWEPGCDPRYNVRLTRDALWKLIDIVIHEGYRINVEDLDPYKLYHNIWRETRKRYIHRELWHRYILLKFFYRLGARIDYKLLDKLYDLFIRLRSRHFILFPGVRNVLEYLRGRGYTLVLTTGTGAHDLPLGILRNTGVDKYFHLVFSTQLVGIPKNYEDFYGELVDVLGISASRIVHIGDSLEHDIYPAKRVGLKTIYYGWRTMCRAVDPKPCITSLYELYHLL
jgi:putative hydrolase of the HAD superfamily